MNKRGPGQPAKPGKQEKIRLTETDKTNILAAGKYYGWTNLSDATAGLARTLAHHTISTGEVMSDTSSSLPPGVTVVRLHSEGVGHGSHDAIVVSHDHDGRCAICGKHIGKQGYDINRNSGLVRVWQRVCPVDGPSYGPWVEVNSDQEIPAAAAKVAEQARDQDASMASSARVQAQQALDAALQRLESGEDLRVVTSDDGEPGVIRNGDQLVSWVYETADHSEIVEVYAPIPAGILSAGDDETETGE